MHPTLEIVQLLAKESGAILRAGYGQKHQVDHKGLVDLVTEMDRKSENYLIEQIQSRYPDHQIISEESGHLNGDHNHGWYIDPLDGTVNYAHGIPIFSVSIAYLVNQTVQIGAVYDPMRDELFSAERGEGAFLNGEPLHVSSAQKMIDSLLVTGFPYDLWSSKVNNLEYFSRFSRQSQGVRRLGSAALDLCYVAAGRFDGYWEIKLSPWDIAAGTLIAQEAGALVTDMNGSPDFLRPPYSIVTANQDILPLMLAVLKEQQTV